MTHLEVGFVEGRSLRRRIGHLATASHTSASVQASSAANERNAPKRGFRATKCGGQINSALAGNQKAGKPVIEACHSNASCSKPPSLPASPPPRPRPTRHLHCPQVWSPIRRWTPRSRPTPLSPSTCPHVLPGSRMRRSRRRRASLPIGHTAWSEIASVPASGLPAEPATPVAGSDRLWSGWLTALREMPFPSQGIADNSRQISASRRPSHPRREQAPIRHQLVRITGASRHIDPGERAS